MNRPKSTLLSTAAMMVALMVMLPFLAQGKGKRERWADGAQQRRADAIFMEAMRVNAIDNDDAYFELLRSAYNLDTANTEIGMMLGYYYLMLGQRDTLLPYQGFAMMKRHFDAHPDDYYNSLLYGSLNSRLGNTDESVRVWQIVDSINPHKPDVALSYASALQMTRDSANMRRSIDVLNRIERAEGVDVGLSSHKIRALAAMNDTAAIIAEINHLLQARGNRPRSMVFAGDVYSTLSMADSALAYYNLACEADSTDGLAYYSRARFYLDQDNMDAYNNEIFNVLVQDGVEFEDKMAIFKEYVKQTYGVPYYVDEVVEAATDVDSVGIESISADSLLPSDNIRRIQSVFDALLKQYPHEPDLRDFYSSFLVSEQKTSAAAEQQEYVLDQDPSDLDRWLTTMSLYTSAELYPKAIEVGHRALKYFPDNPKVLFYIGTNHSMADETDLALEYVKKANDAVSAADDPEFKSSIISTIGDIYYNLKRNDEAFAQYELALEYNPDNFLALNNYAYFLAENNGDLEKAEKMSARVIEAAPDNDTYLDTYAWILFKLKRYAEAKEFIDMVLEIESANQSADVLHHAGDIYYMNGDHDMALTYWQAALLLEPDNPDLRRKVRTRSID